MPQFSLGPQPNALITRVFKYGAQQTAGVRADLASMLPGALAAAAQPRERLLGRRSSTGVLSD